MAARTVAGAAALLVALALGGCGGTEDGTDSAGAGSAAPTTPGSSSPAPPSEGQEAGALAVTSTDFAFALDDQDLAAGSYEITLTNEGDSTHDLVVERDGEEVAAAAAADPGQSSAVTVTLEPGKYVFYCSIANHRAMGMEIPVEVA